MTFTKHGLVEGVEHVMYGHERNYVKFIKATADAPARFEDFKAYKESCFENFEKFLFLRFQTYQDLDRNCYINIPVLGDHGGIIFKWVPLPSEAFSILLLRMVPGISLKTIEAHAAGLKAVISYSRPPLPLYNRIANLGDVIYYDLNDAEGNIVKITAVEWDVVQESPVPFNTTGLPVPIPESGGTLELLMRYLNIDEDDFPLAYAWVITALWQVGKYLILYIIGPHGSGKSTTSTILRNLVDPSATPLNEPPSSIRDLNAYAHHSVVVAYNNVSKITDTMSDAFCRMATEGGSINRKLFSDAEQSTLNTNRPVILNGITPATHRPDFHSRTMLLKSRLLSPKDYPKYTEKTRNYPTDYPKILGALFDGLVAALKNKDTTVLQESPRMVEAATLVTAAEPGMGIESGTFVKRMLKQQQERDIDMVENSVVGNFVYHTLLASTTQWVGTRKELLEAIMADSNVFGIKPHSCQAITKALTDLAPNFASLDILIDFDYQRGADRLICIQRNNVIEGKFGKPSIKRVRLNKPSAINHSEEPRKPSK